LAAKGENVMENESATELKLYGGEQECRLSNTVVALSRDGRYESDSRLQQQISAGKPIGGTAKWRTFTIPTGAQHKSHGIRLTVGAENKNTQGKTTQQGNQIELMVWPRPKYFTPHLAPQLKKPILEN
jgi:hypothetical protein